ncbi:hypothetical protein I3843_16G082800 [Carya illinoinensis]|uniref:Uncharacterized protein n=1 Tax=Carya illinoinensis TaxID=32201 RepID=A0A8T1N2K4_CARIL|nr:cleavage stimulating factor 64 [Carya illinoinensis]KAG2664542.1 hypothetical protein I3760_16G086800 [Carya illinoinensis]KAG6625316.1 hypothetical protein CIPAW_16G086800 [Carya illinoinensis]KAG7942107.1 hypothetical protein I3843_16G082800 [Carya illinoinensis]
MAGKQVAGDGISANFAGMSKHQLYEIMSQMKTLIEQNQQQARQILIQNPLLTKALFQAQIMLGMVQPPQAIPNIQPTVSQHPQQSAQPILPSNIPSANSSPSQVGLQEQTGASQIPPTMKQHQNQAAIPVSSAALPTLNLQAQPMSSHPLQMPQPPKGHITSQMPPMSLPQSSQLPNIPSLPLYSSSQPPPLQQPQMPNTTNQLQQPLQTPGISHLPLQPPLPMQPRLPSVPAYHHQYAPQMGPNLGFQHPGASQHPSQPFFHPGGKPPASIGLSFPQGQPPLPNQPLSQSLYQGGGQHVGTEFSNQGGNSMQVDRGSSWMSGPPENSTVTQHPGLPGPPPVVPAQMGVGNQSGRNQSLTPEMEKALLQQVMSLTPEQINLLPPEQRNQVLQLQQILRQ